MSQDMPNRNLQFTEGNSKKFWSIKLSGKSHSVTYGKIGTAGRSVIKTFSSATEAKASYKKLIDTKLSKGYVGASVATSSIEKPTKTKKKAAKPAASGPRSVRDCWTAISDWLREHDGVAFKVPDGIKAAEIAKVEKSLGRKLPKDFRDSMKVQCTTSIPSPTAFWGFECAYTLMPPDACLRTWRMLTELYDLNEFTDSNGRVEAGKGVVQQWWSPCWFPFAGNGGGDYYCIDLGPTYPGVVGQVIFFCHDSPTRPVFAQSFGEFMLKFTDAVCAGHYIWNSEELALQRHRKTAFPYEKNR